MCFKGNNMEYLTATSMLRVGGRWRNIHSEKSGERIKKRNISTCPSLFDFGGSPPWLKFLSSFSRLVSFDLSSSYNKRTNGIAKSYTELRNLIYRHGNRVHTWFTTAFFLRYTILQVSKSFVTAGVSNVFPPIITSCGFPLPASRFWESAEQMTVCYRFLTTYLTYKAYWNNLNPAQMRVVSFQWILNFRVNNNDNSVDRSQDDSFPRQG